MRFLPPLRDFSVVTLLLCSCLYCSCTRDPDFDIIIRNGTVYDGSGSSPFVGDVAINGDTIVGAGDIAYAIGRLEIDASRMAVAPGFINMLSWANESLIEEGLSQSDVRQGVTLEVMGEGWSMGPLNDAMKKDQFAEQGDIRYDITWTTLGEYLDYLAGRGVSTNIASFVGATTLRIHEIGYQDRPPTAPELDSMRALVRQAMEEGALGVASSLIYAPAFYARTDEIIELCKVAGEYDGIYISHIRSEGDRLLEAIDEFLTICREADVAGEIYHFKALGRANWPQLNAAITKIEDARSAGQRITADMYTYTAGQTGLDAVMPPWVQEGGQREWEDRLRDPAIRKKVQEEMSAPADQWENFYVAVGSPENIILEGFKSDSLKQYTGKTLADVAALRGSSPQETAMDLVIQDRSRVEAVYFLMSEDNVRKKIGLPWVSFGSDAASLAPEGVFLKSNPHPRAYGNFARLLGKYVREEGVIRLEEAIRRLTSFPAKSMQIRKRGLLEKGYYADVVIFDPDFVIDRATYEQPHQYATGVKHVFVNGVHVIDDGDHTGATPGRVVRGPGWGGGH
ncbi:MAG: D-aminoacylase [Ignavibacteria bacterium]|nr:D-aminoacylase [Ignavibacteria bacterium]